MQASVLDSLCVLCLLALRPAHAVDVPSIPFTRSRPFFPYGSLRLHVALSTSLPRRVSCCRNVRAWMSSLLASSLLLSCVHGIRLCGAAPRVPKRTHAPPVARNLRKVGFPLNPHRPSRVLSMVSPEVSFRGGFLPLLQSGHRGPCGGHVSAKPHRSSRVLSLVRPQGLV